jgi:hypothetical protein
MTRNRMPDVAAAEATPPPLPLEKAQKGSNRSMWELLLQLRTVLPYLARLVSLLEPLIDRGLLKPPPVLTELNKELAAIQTGGRDLEVQVRNQALQLERIEQQMGRLQVVHENSMEESRKLYAEVQLLRRGLFAVAIVVVVLLLLCVGMVAVLVMHS